MVWYCNLGVLLLSVLCSDSAIWGFHCPVPGIAAHFQILLHKSGFTAWSQFISANLSWFCHPGWWDLEVGNVCRLAFVFSVFSTVQGKTMVKIVEVLKIVEVRLSDSDVSLHLNTWNCVCSSLQMTKSKKEKLYGEQVRNIESHMSALHGFRQKPKTMKTSR